VSLPGNAVIATNALEAKVNSTTMISNRLYTTGVLQLRATETGATIIYLHVSVPAYINGKAQHLKRVDISYKTDNSICYINSTEASICNNGTAITKISDSFNRNSTSWTSYSINDDTPDPITGAVLIKLTVQHNATGNANDIEIGPVQVTLTD